VVNTIGGSFRAEGTNVGSVVKLKRLGDGAVTNPVEAVKKSVTDKVGSDLKKKLFGK
jgi:hypothetical protein